MLFHDGVVRLIRCRHNHEHVIQYSTEMEMSVSEFLSSLPEGKRRCFRLTNEEECHHGFQYQDGVNRLPPNETFNPSGDCEPGGLYFFTEEHLEGYRGNVSNVDDLKWIREVSFGHPDVHNARIYINPDNEKCKCNKFFLGERKEFFIDDYVEVTSENVFSFHGRHVRWTSELALAVVQQNGRALQYIPETLRDSEICLTAVRQYGRALQFVPETLPEYREMCSVAVKQNGWALQHVPEVLRDREVCLAAVNQNGWELAYVPRALRDRDMCLAAVNQNGYALQFVPEALPEYRDMCLAAVKQNGDVLAYVPVSLIEEVKRYMKK